MPVFDLKDSSQVKDAQSLLTQAMIDGSKVEIIRKNGRRTLTQNSALHMLFSQIAETLNESGLDMKRVLRQEVDIPWTMELAKDFLWRPIQKAITGKESTSDLTTKEIDEVFAVLQRHLNQQLGISINFPSIETLILEQKSGQYGNN